MNDAHKEFQRQGVLWPSRDEDNRNVDVIPPRSTRRCAAGTRAKSCRP